MATLLATVALLSGCAQAGPSGNSTQRPRSSVHKTTVAEIQTKDAVYTDGDSMTVTGLTGITKGDGLIAAVFAVSGGPGATFPTVTNVTGGGVTFSEAATYQLRPYAALYTLEIWVGTNSSGGQTTVTADLGGTLGDGALFVGEFSGLALTPFDTSARSFGTTPVTTYTTPPLTPSSPGEVIWAVGRWPNTMGTNSTSPWSGMVSGNDHSLVSLYTVSRDATGLSAEQGSWTNNGDPADEVTLVAGFKTSAHG